MRGDKNCKLNVQIRLEKQDIEKVQVKNKRLAFHKVLHMIEETQIIVDLVHLFIIIASGWYLRSVLNG